MKDELLNIGRVFYIKIRNKEQQQLEPHQDAQINCQMASDLIKKKLNSSSPCMIGRFGSVELKIVDEYCNSKLGIKKYFKFISGDIDSYKISSTSLLHATNNAGIFPSNIDLLSKFSDLMLEDMKELDILGSWLNMEKNFKEQLSDASKVRLPDLEPYYHNNPWSSCLKGKDVLVIHPFAQTIKKQYKKRERIFENPLILPDFNLKTIQSIQSNANEKVNFTDWFEALNYMKGLIDQTTFDIAIIGCGAYGFPLAAHVKRMGKKSIHLGGATQILFGIKGSRWSNHDIISRFFNDDWVFPSKEETPKGYANVEKGCYW